MQPDMRPSVKERATRSQCFCSTPSGGVSLCSSGMPLAAGPWKRTTTMTSLLNSASLEGAFDLVLLVEDAHRCLMVKRSSGTAEILMLTARPSSPCSRRRSPSARNCSPTGRKHVGIGAVIGDGRPAACRRAAWELARSPPANRPRQRAHQRCSKPAAPSSRIKIPCRPLAGSGSRRLCCSDTPAPARARWPRARPKSSQRSPSPAARAMATRMQQVIGRTARRVQPDHRVDQAALVDDVGALVT